MIFAPEDVYVAYLKFHVYQTDFNKFTEGITLTTFYTYALAFYVVEVMMSCDYTNNGSQKLQ